MSFVSFSFSAFAQCELYELDLVTNELSNSNYSATCGQVTAGQWIVKNDTCSLTTASVTIPGAPGLPQIFPLDVNVHKSGNMENNDSVTVEYFKNGVSVIKARKAATQIINNDTSFHFSVSATGTDIISVTVTYSNNVANIEKWFLKDGDICLGMTTIMPIELISFNAQTENDRVKLFWITASEKDNDYFLVEKSQNGASFQKVAVIDGAGTSNSRKNYSAYDNHPVFGTSYYRLKQTDFDGKFEYSDAVSVSVNFSSTTCKFKVIPNPCSPQCTVQMNGCQEENISVALVDAMGNEVYSNIPVSEGNKSFTIDPTNNLKPGVYILTGRGQNEKPSQRIMVH